MNDFTCHDISKHNTLNARIWLKPISVYLLYKVERIELANCLNYI